MVYDGLEEGIRDSPDGCAYSWEIDSEVLIRPLQRVSLCDDGKFLSLHLGLYVLRHAPRLWQEKLQSIVNRMKFAMLMSKECMSRRQ